MKKKSKLLVFFLGVFVLHLTPNTLQAMVQVENNLSTNHHLVSKSITSDPIVIKEDADGKYVDINHPSFTPSADLELKFRNHYRVKECTVTLGNMRLYFEDNQTDAEITRFCNDYFNL